MTAPMPTFSTSTDAIALVAATAKSILEIATPASTGALIIGWWCEFDGVTASNVPVKLEVGRFSAAVTTATTATPSKMGYGQNALASQATVKNSTTAEGAGTFVDGEIHRIPPTSGIYIQYPLGREWSLPASSFWRIRCTAAAGVNVTFGIQWAE
jgi:hypothetical protein